MTLALEYWNDRVILEQVVILVTKQFGGLRESFPQKLRALDNLEGDLIRGMKSPERTERRYPQWDESREFQARNA